MLRINFIFLMLFFLISCKGQKVDIQDYIKIKGDTIKVEVPFYVLAELPFKNSEPYIVCLREEYAYRFGGIDMHFEHSKPRILYSNVLKIPLDTLKKMDDESFRKETETFYSSKKPDDYDIRKKKIYKATLIQKIYKESNTCIVECKERNFKYRLEKTDGNWYIVYIGPSREQDYWK